MTRAFAETDFNRLFVGPGTLLAVPYESFYKTMKDEMGAATCADLEQQVAACYALNGFKCPTISSTSPTTSPLNWNFGVMADKEADAFPLQETRRSRSHSQCGRGSAKNTL